VMGRDGHAVRNVANDVQFLKIINQNKKWRKVPKNITNKIDTIHLNIITKT
jgi:hypothetical protein